MLKISIKNPQKNLAQYQISEKLKDLERTIENNWKYKLAILKIFNLVLEYGHLPESLGEGLTTPIFKNGDKFNANIWASV